MRRFALALAGVAVFAASPALAESCIRHNDIYNWSAINDRTLILENYRHQKFLVKMIGTCGNFKFHQRIEIKSHSSFGISCVESGDDVVTRDIGFRGTCSITSVVPYVTPPKDNKSDSPPHSTY